MGEKMERLQRRFPLPGGYGPPQLFSDHIRCRKGARFFRVGYWVNLPEGKKLSGSAAESVSKPRSRAYFELLERLCVLEAERSGRKTWRAVPYGRGRERRLSNSLVFPESVAPEIWRFSKSNGVALHLSSDEAKERALLELAERDSFLRSWFGETKPLAADLPRSRLLESLREDFAFKVFALPCRWPGIQVSVLFGFPKNQGRSFVGRPLVFGAGAARSWKSASAKSRAECLQRMAFLWDEPISEAVPAFSPTPNYHLELYLHPEGIERIQNWLAGGHLKWGMKSRLNTELTGPVYWLDLTPKHLQGKVFVVKAYAKNIRPLVFGKDRINAPAGFPEELLTHPLA